VNTLLSEFYIDGQWVDPESPQSIPIINPATETAIGTVSIGNASDVNRAVAAAKRAFETFSLTSREERMALLDRVIRAFLSRYDDLVRAITSEIGAPLQFSRQVQVGLALEHFKQARAIIEDYRFEYTMGSTQVRREAFGVCGLITAWNWPINLIASKVAPALAGGCTVVLKPSELSPISATILAEVMHDAGVPPGVFNMVHGFGPDVGHALASHPDVDLISITGSVRAGIEVARTAATTVKRVHQELGGKSANIILPDADLSKAIPDAVRRTFINSGQSCIAPTRLLIHESQLPEALYIAKTFAESLVIGDPLKEGCQLGPIANEAQFNRIQAMIKVGIEEGAELLCGGTGRPNGLDRGFYARPTIFTAVKSSMRIAKEEIFGPVLAVLSYRDENEAISIANDTVYGLAGYVSSVNLHRARAVANRMRAGRIFINGAPTDAIAPFGGYKQSGNGREVGIFGLEDFLEIKAVLGYEQNVA
jgi:aldehyde dehydrogenase (NAD+)